VFPLAGEGEAAVFRVVPGVELGFEQLFFIYQPACSQIRLKSGHVAARLPVVKESDESYGFLLVNWFVPIWLFGQPAFCSFSAAPFSLRVCGRMTAAE
jgi:hypothetical protein